MPSLDHRRPPTPGLAHFHSCLPCTPSWTQLSSGRAMSISVFLQTQGQPVPPSPVLRPGLGLQASYLRPPSSQLQKDGSFPGFNLWVESLVLTRGCVIPTGDVCRHLWMSQWQGCSCHPVADAAPIPPSPAKHCLPNSPGQGDIWSGPPQREDQGGSHAAEGGRGPIRPHLSVSHNSRNVVKSFFFKYCHSHLLIPIKGAISYPALQKCFSRLNPQT